MTGTSHYALYHVSQNDYRLIPPILVPTKLQDSRPSSSHLALSLSKTPLVLIGAFLEAQQGTITGQIALKIAIEALVNKANEFSNLKSEIKAQTTFDSAELVHSSLKLANLNVYHYSKQMRSDTDIAASGMFYAFDGQQITVAMFGQYQCFLIRQGVISDLYSPTETDPTTSNTSKLIGMGPKILVDLVTFQVNEGDLLLFGSALSVLLVSRWVGHFMQMDSAMFSGIIREIALEAAADCVKRLDSEQGMILKNSLVGGVWLAEPRINLNQVVE